MSQNVEIVRRGIEAALRRPTPDFATMNDLYHPDHEFISRMDVLEGGGGRGVSGYRDWVVHTQDAFEWWGRLEQVTEIDNNRILAITPTHIRGKSSGLALNEERVACIVTVRAGKIIRTEVYNDQGEALKAVGLEE